MSDLTASIFLSDFKIVHTFHFLSQFWWVVFFKKLSILFMFSIFFTLYFLTSLKVFSSVQFSRSVVSDSLWPHEPQHSRPPCPSPIPGVHPNSCPLSRRCHLTISYSAIPFSPHLQSFPTSGSFQMSQLFASGSQSIGSFSFNISPSNEYIQDWFPLGRTGWISLQSKGLSRVFSNTTVQKHQFFSAQLSLQSNSHIHIHDHWKNHSLD